MNKEGDIPETDTGPVSGVAEIKGEENEAKAETGAEAGTESDSLPETEQATPRQASAGGRASKDGKSRRKGKSRGNRKSRDRTKDAVVKSTGLGSVTTAAPAIMVQPIASPAKMKRRHWGLMFSFLLFVLGPLVGIIFYLWTYAQDQYISTTGFTVRSQESGGATELLGGLAQFAGGSTASDSDILYEFIQSQEMVEAVDARVDLRAHYSGPWPEDWAFAIWPDSSVEDLIWYWQRIVGISYDSGTGLIEVQAQAFDPDTAQKITTEIVRESQDRLNALNSQARTDAMRYANADLEAAIAQLKSAREALTKFRTRTNIVDPAADIQARLGVMTNLQQKLAEALIEHDLLLTTTKENDPRLTQAQRRIDVIRERIVIERQTFTSANTETGAVGEDYPTLISEFEALNVDLDYAQEAYHAALAARGVARDDVARQSRYLATYIKPTRPQSSEYPERFILSGLAGVFLLLIWSILTLVYYSVRDRS